METRKNGAWVEATRAEVFYNGAWRTIKRAEAYVGGAWRKTLDFLPALSLSVSPDSLSKGGITVSLTTAPATASPTGGHAPYSYAWTLTANDGPVIINDAGVSSTDFTADMTGRTTTTATARCTVTDANGTTATDDITIAFFFHDIGDTGLL